MATPTAPTADTDAPVPILPKRELTWQSILGAFVVSCIVAGSYPYVVLKLGMGSNASVVAAFLGAIFLNLTAWKTRGNNRLLNNVIQTAGTSATGTAFMCVVAAAFGFLDQNEVANVHVHIGSWEMFTWLTCSGMIGVVFTALFRKHFLDDPRMIFADGVAAAETVLVLDAGEGTGGKIKALGIASLASAALDWLREGMHLLPTWYFGSKTAESLAAGIEPGLLTIGSGLLVGLNVALSMVLGSALILFVIGPWVIGSGVGEEIVRSQILPQYWDQCQAAVHAATPTAAQTAFIEAHCGKLPQLVGGNHFGIVLLWAMWPATALMVATAGTAIALRWRSVVDTFRNLNMDRGVQGEDMGVKAIVGWAVVLTVLLAIIQNIHFGMSYIQTVVAVLASLPLMLVGTRVLGETNQGPVSAMANALQAVFAVFWPQHIGLNLIAAGMAGNTSVQSEGTMQDFKTGRIVGSTPRILTYVQLAAVPIGAAAVAIMYPLLVRKYGLGSAGLSAPTGIKLANMAVLLSQGFGALPRFALQATIFAAILGIVIAIVQNKKHIPWIPSTAALGFALILPGTLNIPMGIGGIAGYFWMKKYPENYEKYAITVASGFIAGEALLGGLILPALFALGRMK
jgi:OPT family oligopeptide transporter